jgi:hypothetical protein
LCQRAIGFLCEDRRDRLRSGHLVSFSGFRALPGAPARLHCILTFSTSTAVFSSETRVQRIASSEAYPCPICLSSNSRAKRRPRACAKCCSHARGVSDRAGRVGRGGERWPRAEAQPALPTGRARCGVRDAVRLADRSALYDAIGPVLLPARSEVGWPISASTTRTLQSGNATLFLLIRRMTTDKVLAALHGAGGTVMRSSFDESKEEALQAALAGARAASAEATGRGQRLSS